MSSEQFFAKLRLGALTAAALLFLILSSSAAEPKTDAAGSDVTAGEKVIRDLLDYPAPNPDWRKYLKAHPYSPERPRSDASSVALLNYWQSAPNGAEPETETRERLLQLIEQQPANVDGLLRWMPQESIEVHDRLKRIEERMAAQKSRQAETIVGLLRDWLMLHSRYFRDELKRQTLWPDDVPEDKAKNARAAFIRLDRKEARAFFSEKTRSSEAKNRAIAWTELRQNFAETVSQEARQTWRDGLKAIAADPKAEGDERSIAVVELMAEEWDGRDEWFLALFSDPSLSKSDSNSESPTPLSAAVERDGDYWIPKVAPLVQQKGARRINAIRCLLQFKRERARADALKPLLPWIANPHWAPDSNSANRRLSLLAFLGRVDLPGSVPSLLEAARTAKDFELQYIAADLAHYHAREAVPILKNAVGRERDESHRRAVVEAIYQLGGFSRAEIVAALRAFAVKASTEAGQKEIDEANDITPAKTLSPIESIGDQLTRTKIDDPEVISALAQAARELQKTDRASAETLWQIVARCTTAKARTAIIEELRRGTFAATWAVELLGEKDSLGEALRDVDELHGIALGLQTALADKTKQTLAVLAGDDRLAKLCLIASARLAHVSLPVDRIEPLLESSDELTSNAAQAYLEADNSAAARAAVWKRAGGRPDVLGARPGTDPGHFTYGPLGEKEQELVQRVQSPEGPEEIYALLSGGYWGDQGQVVVLKYRDKVVLRCQDGNDRSRERLLTGPEASELSEWLEKARVADLPPYDEGVMDGIQYEYFHVSSQTARRVFMNNPPGSFADTRFQPATDADRPDPAIYGELVQRFTTLAQEPMKVSYPSLSGLAGYRIVHSAAQGEAVAFALKNGHAAVAIRPGRDADLEWHQFDEAGISKGFSRDLSIERDPTVNPYEADKGVDLKEGPLSGWTLQAEWAGEGRKPGLWALRKGKKPVRIASGIFGRPVVTPGGEWIVAAKTPTGEMWDVPNGVMRINLHSHETIPLDIPPADNFDPVVWIPAHQRVLLHRARDDDERAKAGPARPEFYLLDPTTGRHEQVTGEFRPCFDAAKHPLQSTKRRPNEYWAILNDRIDDRVISVLGRYDLEHFKFVKVLRFPEVWLQSADVWVDTESRRVWTALNGDLLCFDLPPDGAGNSQEKCP